MDKSLEKRKSLVRISHLREMQTQEILDRKLQIAAEKKASYKFYQMKERELKNRARVIANFENKMLEREISVREFSFILNRKVD